MTSERADSFSDVQCIGLRFQPHRNAAFGISVLERRYKSTLLQETDFVGTVGFDCLCKHIRDGQKTCRDIEEFFKKRLLPFLTLFEPRYGKIRLRDFRSRQTQTWLKNRGLKFRIWEGEGLKIKALVSCAKPTSTFAGKMYMQPLPV